jgi:hypothetical protein
LLKSGSARTGAEDSFSLISMKLCSAFVPQWNFPFFMHSVIGATIRLKFLTNYVGDGMADGTADGVGSWWKLQRGVAV